MGSLPLHPPPLTPSANTVPSAAPVPPSTASVDDSQPTRKLLEQVHTCLSDSLKAVSDKLKASFYW
ncbi:hypothetical protein E2C01_100479 [Portunus trituberculatus]|uniref:Uncharacterized protein n=1 Tax=Portunus trituberculatus TaxID=210409 RepID=A0A5B7K345_PORTR|nr:hypothetical protein [Portunus trituberculatus]